jgi:hypothetical protein
MSILTSVGEQSHIAGYLADSVQFGEYELRQHWGSLNGNYVVDGRNFAVLDARVDYEPEYIAVVAVEPQCDAPAPVPEPGSAVLMAVALLVGVIWRPR